MPIYEYQCETCAILKEVIHKVDEQIDVMCEVCEDKPMHKVISASGFRLIGAGFYQNDYGQGDK